ncbi:MAG: NADP-dependent oxidoreductase [Solirubrobacterales bacterium]|nr:NADP-dependent oxidoreductase [Solirubrobacterales bacterium]OJU96315.1 MAG: NADP-dependent oxidoreductase [Solirubrobacterales bacterium 67-14]
MSKENRRFALAERPTGLIDESTFTLETNPVPEIGDGEALVQVKWISIDPTNRTWIGEEPTYLPPVQIGETMRALGLGEVVASNNESYPVGSLVTGLTGWADYTVASDSNPLMVVPESAKSAPPASLLGILGMTGATAFFGMLEIGEPKEGETVVVSAAAGAVGSVAGQLAKLKGARVVGIAGGPEKCAWVIDELGFDAAVDYKADDWRQQLKDATPDGIDVDFENVGGEIMEAVLLRLNINARVALCGLISGYNDDARPLDPRIFGRLLVNRVKLQGFIILDYYARFGEAIRELSQWVAEGKIKSEQTVVEGFENLPNALNMLFKGENKGKLVVKIND